MTKVLHAELCSLCLAGAVQAAPFTNLISFGDSLSDVGNDAGITNPGIAPLVTSPLLKKSHSKKTDGVGFEAVSVSPCVSTNLRHGDFEGEAKGEAVCPPALFGGGPTAAPADQAERLGSLIKAEVIPSEVAELAAVWHRLPDAVRAGIVAMVRASGG